MTDGRLLPPRIAQWWASIQFAAKTFGVDPLWLAAICEQESRGGQAPGYAPKGAGGKGDFGHGHGLFQIDDRSHAHFIAQVLKNGRPAWADPRENALMAAQILKEALVAFHGDYFLAACGYNAGVHRVKGAILRLGPGPDKAAARAAADSVTTPRGDGVFYGSSVLEHLKTFGGTA